MADRVSSESIPSMSCVKTENSQQIDVSQKAGRESQYARMLNGYLFSVFCNVWLKSSRQSIKEIIECLTCECKASVT